MIPILLTIAAVVISAANFVVLLASFRRAGQWKDSDEARLLIERVRACEAGLTVVKGATDQTPRFNQRLGVAEQAIIGINARMENVATKADIARLAAEVAAVEGHASRIENGVERIEGYLMNRQTA